MISADLNGDGLADLIVGYVNAPGVIYYYDGTGKHFDVHPFGNGLGNGGWRPQRRRAARLGGGTKRPSFILFQPRFERESLLAQTSEPRSLNIGTG